MHNKARCLGFSLLELGLVMVIIGGLAGVSVMLGGEWIKKEEVTTTKLLMDTVEGALDTYRKVNGRLPCPADIALTRDDANYGFEAYEAFRTPGEILGECVDSTGSDGSINAIDAGGDVSFGAVPAKTLGLSESVMRDQWGNLIGYYVTNRATREGSFWDSPRHSNFIAMDDNTVGAITIQDETGGVRTVDALYALVSHGRNEHGAYNAQGDRLDANAPTAQELENCDCDANAADTGTNSVLVARLLDESYDDLVQYKERRHLFNAVALGQCEDNSSGPAAPLAEFTTPGSHSWTVPAGVTSVTVYAIGAGGGNGGQFYDAGAGGWGGYGGGGGGGAFAYDTVSVTPGASISIQVGAGGVGRSAANGVGGNGGNSSFGTDVVAQGGRGGNGGPCCSSGTGGLGGTVLTGQGNAGGRGGTGGGGGGAGSYGSVGEDGFNVVTSAGNGGGGGSGNSDAPGQAGGGSTSTGGAAGPGGQPGESAAHGEGGNYGGGGGSASYAAPAPGNGAGGAVFILSPGGGGGGSSSTGYQPDGDTVLLIKSGASDGSTTITDSSPSAHSLTVNGSVHHDAGQTLSGKSTALYFDGSGDNILAPHSSDWAFGTGDFTIEMWAYPDPSKNMYGFFAWRPNTSTLGGNWINWYGRSYDAWKNTAEAGVDNSGTNCNVTPAPFGPNMNDGQWRHIALVRSGTTLTAYINGQAIASCTNTANIMSQMSGVWQQPNISYNNSGYDFRGWMDEIRISRIARYTGDFDAEATLRDTNGCGP